MIDFILSDLFRENELAGEAKADPHRLIASRKDHFCSILYRDKVPGGLCLAVSDFGALKK
jgi:hypothetical protein